MRELGGGGQREGRVHIVRLPGAMHVTQRLGEPHIAVVPVTLSDACAGGWVSLSDPEFGHFSIASVV